MTFGLIELSDGVPVVAAHAVCRTAMAAAVTAFSGVGATVATNHATVARLAGVGVGVYAGTREPDYVKEGGLGSVSW